MSYLLVPFPSSPVVRVHSTKFDLDSQKRGRSGARYRPERLLPLIVGLEGMGGKPFHARPLQPQISPMPKRACKPAAEFDPWLLRRVVRKCPRWTRMQRKGRTWTHFSRMTVEVQIDRNGHRTVAGRLTKNGRNVGPRHSACTRRRAGRKDTRLFKPAEGSNQKVARQQSCSDKDTLRILQAILCVWSTKKYIFTPNS